MAKRKFWQHLIQMFDTDMQRDGYKRGVCHATRCIFHPGSNNLSIRSIIYNGRQTTGVTIKLPDVF